MKQHNFVVGVEDYRFYGHYQHVRGRTLTVRDPEGIETRRVVMVPTITAEREIAAQLLAREHTLDLPVAQLALIHGMFVGQRVRVVTRDENGAVDLVVHESAVIDAALTHEVWGKLAVRYRVEGERFDSGVLAASHLDRLPA